jgi:ribonuclease BN (tRNA processing enzyme)
MRIQKVSSHPLTNDGELEIFFIGAGSAFASTLDQTNFLIIKGDKHIMVDFGMKGPDALFKTTGKKPVDIKVILPTHSHADHVGGIECLGLMNRYVGQRFMNKPKLKMIISEDYQRVLWDRTLRGGMEDNEAPGGKGQKLSFVDFFDVLRPKWQTHAPREIYEVDYEGIHLEMFRTMHIPEQSKSWEESFISYGLMIDGRVFVSGDTRFDMSLINMYQHAEVLFHDVQFFPGAVHTFLDELKELHPDLKKRMYLMHYADDYLKQDISDFAGWVEAGVRYIFE